MEERFNVASASGLPGPIDRLWERFSAAGFPDNQLPDDHGWMSVDVFSGQVVGRIAVRDRLAEQVAASAGRAVAYSRAQKCNLMKEGRILERCDWAVRSIPAICCGSMTAIARELVEARQRRGRIGTKLVVSKINAECAIHDATVASSAPVQKNLKTKPPRG